MRMCANTSGDNGPRKPAVDFSYLEEFGSRDPYKIPTCFEKCNFKRGQQFEARISYIYDPSKFWMVIKFQELEIFQKYLFRFYYINRTHYKIPKEKIALELYCVSYVDNSYYRGVIIGFPVTTGVTHGQENQVVQVYFIDFGLISVVDVNHIYYLSEKCFKIPQFAVRACLAGICPLKYSTWCSEDVNEFHKLVSDKTVRGFIMNIDSQREVLEIVISVKDEISSISVQETLKSKQRARYFHEKKTEVDNQKYQLKYPYLFPSHSVIESGKVPFALSDSEYQEQIAPQTSIFGLYYQNNNVD